jgi:hypothetical protein
MNFCFPDSMFYTKTNDLIMSLLWDVRSREDSAYYVMEDRQRLTEIDKRMSQGVHQARMALSRAMKPEITCPLRNACVGTHMTANPLRGKIRKWCYRWPKLSVMQRLTRINRIAMALEEMALMAKRLETRPSDDKSQDGL